MIRQMTLAALVALLTAPSGARAEADPPAAPFDDAAFVKAVAVGGLYEGHLSNLVGSQSKNSAVRTFAAGVVADHIVGSTGLKAAAKDIGVELPTKLDDTHQKRFEAFKESKGDELDRDYVKAMAERRAAAVALFTRASKEAKNPAVKEFATKTLPTIQKHLEAAKNLDK